MSDTALGSYNSATSGNPWANFAGARGSSIVDGLDQAFRNPMHVSRNIPEIWTKPDGSMRLGTLSFDPSARELRDAEGRVLELRRQSSDVLAVLARRPGETVLKDELILAVWKDVAVTDDSLVQCIGDTPAKRGRHVCRMHVA